MARLEGNKDYKIVAGYFPVTWTPRPDLGFHNWETTFNGVKAIVYLGDSSMGLEPGKQYVSQIDSIVVGSYGSPRVAMDAANQHLYRLNAAR